MQVEAQIDAEEAPSATSLRMPEVIEGSRPNPWTSIPFVIAHLMPLLAFWTGVTTTAIVMCVVFYFGRMFCITAGYHRYFSHRSYRMGRVMQFLMAFGGSMAAQKGPLWWASHHRRHHRFSDEERDLHSPVRKGFWWAHVGWILCDESGGTDYDAIRDFAKYPELRFLDRHDWIGPWTLGVASFLIGGWSGLIVGFFLSTVLLWHGTFLVNSLNHVWGTRRYETSDESRNNFLIALFTGGEGWHNNHHRYQSSVRQGFFWWEFDPTYYLLVMMSWVGLVRDLRKPPLAMLEASRIRPKR